MLASHLDLYYRIEIIIIRYKKRRSISLTEFEDKKFTGVKRVLMISANTLVGGNITPIECTCKNHLNVFRVGFWPIETCWGFFHWM